MAAIDRRPPGAAPSLEAVTVARRYYLEDHTKSEIARDLGLSRFKVARLLDEAKASGIVKISIEMPPDMDVALGEQLARAFSLRRAIVARVLDDDAATILDSIGAVAAQHLGQVLDEDTKLGIAWGRALTATVGAMSSRSGADVVQLVGGVNGDPDVISGVELVRRLAERTGGNAHPLHAPLLVRTAEMANQLHDEPALAETIDNFQNLTVAAVGIGSWTDGQSMLSRGCTDAERAELLASGAMADVCTLVFDADGQPISTSATRRMVGIQLDDLRRVPEIIAIAGGSGKVDAITAALRSGLITTLITDSSTAQRLLQR